MLFVTFCFCNVRLKKQKCPSSLNYYTTHRRDFDETKCMSFLIKDDELLEKHNEIWEKVKNNIKKEFDSKPVHNEKYLKAKIKSYNGKINTNFHNNKIPTEGSQFICLSVNLIDSVFGTSKNYYPRVFLEDCNSDEEIFFYI